MMHSDGPNNPRVTIAVTRQLNQLRAKVPDGVTVIVNEADIFDIQAELEGPVQTPYEGGVFRFKLSLPADFPKSPPKGYFLTKIFHPNVSEKGEICVNTLKKDWNHQNWSFYHIFEVIKCLLIVPFPESALNEEAGKLFMQDYDSYFKYAKLLTDVHSKPKVSHKMEVEKEKEQVNLHLFIDKLPLSFYMSLCYPLKAIKASEEEKVIEKRNTIAQQLIPQSSQQTTKVWKPDSHVSQNISNTNFSTIQRDQTGTTLPQVQSWQMNGVINNISINSPQKDSSKTQLNNISFVSGSIFQKSSQNQENMQYQTNFYATNSNILPNTPTPMTTTSIITSASTITCMQEEPLCTLSKNNGYFSNTSTSLQPGNQNKSQSSSQSNQMQPQSQFAKSNFNLNLTFNNLTALSSSFVASNISNQANTGKQQNEKKKWLKRI